MAAPVIESGGKKYESPSAESSITVDLPDSLSVGNTILLLVSSEDSAENDPVYDAITGWTEHGEIPDIDQDCQIGVFSRVVDGTEGTTVTIDGLFSNDEWTAFTRQISGAGDIELASYGASNYGSSDVFTIPGVTTPEDDCLVIAHWGTDGADLAPFTLSGTGWGTSPDDTATSAGGNAGNASAFASKTVATAGSSGDLEVTADTGDGWAGWQIVVRPAAGGTNIAPVGSVSTTVSGTAALTASTNVNPGPSVSSPVSAAGDLTASTQVDATASVSSPVSAAADISSTVTVNPGPAVSDPVAATAQFTASTSIDGTGSTTDPVSATGGVTATAELAATGSTSDPVSAASDLTATTDIDPGASVSSPVSAAANLTASTQIDATGSVSTTVSPTANILAALTINAVGSIATAVSAAAQVTATSTINAVGSIATTVSGTVNIIGEAAQALIRKWWHERRRPRRPTRLGRLTAEQARRR